MPAPELTSDEFLERFPEFVTAGEPLTSMKLAEAHRSFDAELFGNLYLDAVGYKAAELLALSPYGTNQRLKESSTQTTYAVALADICSRVPSRFLSLF